jgi:hypothetical protein
MQNTDCISIQGTVIVLKALYAGTVLEVCETTLFLPLHINHAQQFFETHVKTGKSLREPEFDAAVAVVLTAGVWLPPKSRVPGDPPLHLGDHLKLSKLVESNMNGRNCYFTDGIRFGMGPDCIRKGDVLVSIPRGSTLIALRPLKYYTRHTLHLKKLS